MQGQAKAEREFSTASRARGEFLEAPMRGNFWQRLVRGHDFNTSQKRGVAEGAAFRHSCRRANRRPEMQNPPLARRAHITGEAGRKTSSTDFLPHSPTALQADSCHALALPFRARASGPEQGNA